jgi:hypothetical protein
MPKVACFFVCIIFGQHLFQFLVQAPKSLIFVGIDITTVRTMNING